MSSALKARIVSVGHYLPDDKLTNADLENLLKLTTSGSEPERAYPNAAFSRIRKKLPRIWQLKRQKRPFRLQMSTPKA